MHCWDSCQKEPQIMGSNLARAFGDIEMNSLSAHSWWCCAWKVFGKLKWLLGLPIMAPKVTTNPEFEGGSWCKEALSERWYRRSLNSQATTQFTFGKPENFCGESKRHLSFPEFYDNLSEQSETNLIVGVTEGKFTASWGLLYESQALVRKEWTLIPGILSEDDSVTICE